jgi:anaerobic magnesium-protoporphyrin IX monomethyl ester cyclase
MKVLFIHQPFRIGFEKRGNPRIAPRTLLLLGSCLLRNGHTVKVHDMQIDHLGIDSIHDIVREYDPDIVGFTIHSVPHIPTVGKCVKAVRESSKKAVIVTGGLVTSHIKGKIFSQIPELDIVVLNEGEKTVVDLAEALGKNESLDSVNGILYKNGDGELLETASKPLMKDLDDLPQPAYELIEMERYNDPSIIFPYIETQRGCPYSCKFCGVHFPGDKSSRVVRYRNVSDIVDEIELLHGKYGFNKFYFSDDTFTINHQHVNNICNEMIERELNSKVAWSAYTRADRVKPEVLNTMYKAGCRVLAIGIETGSQKGLEKINKKSSIDQYINGIRMIKDAGINVHVLFIIGFPETGHEEIYETLKFLIDNEPTKTQLFVFHPIPGTDFFENPQDYGLFFEVRDREDLVKFDYIEEPLCQTRCLDKEDIIKYYITFNHIFRSFASDDEDQILQKRFLKNAFPRKRRGVVISFLDTFGYYYNPHQPEEMRHVDLWGNAYRLDKPQYEILLRCNGDFTIEEIAETVAKLFDYEYEEANRYVVKALQKFEKLRMIHDLPVLQEYA